MLRSFKYEPFSARIFITILYSIREHLTIEMTIVDRKKISFCHRLPQNDTFHPNFIRVGKRIDAWHKAFPTHDHGWFNKSNPLSLIMHVISLGMIVPAIRILAILSQARRWPSPRFPPSTTGANFPTYGSIWGCAKQVSTTPNVSR